MAEKAKSILSYSKQAPKLGYRLVTPLQQPIATRTKTPILPVMGGVNINVPNPIMPSQQRTPINLPMSDRLINRPAPIAPVVNKSDDYYMQHRPAMRDDDEGTSAPLHDLTKVYPKDVYEKPDWYNMKGELNDSEAFSIARRIKDRPHAIVTIYRAVPKSLKDAKINKGDWVTINKDYARQHGKSNIQGPYKILQMNVNAAEIFTSGDSINEWGYDPLPESEKQKLKDIRLQIYKKKLATKNKQDT
jgi:hypothetical protein